MWDSVLCFVFCLVEEGVWGALLPSASPSSRIRSRGGRFLEAKNSVCSDCCNWWGNVVVGSSLVPGWGA